MIALLGALLAVAGAIILHSEYRPAAGGRGKSSRRPLRRAAGWLLLAAALAALLTHFGPGTAVFVYLLLLMLAWTLSPLLLAWARPAAKGK